MCLLVRQAKVPSRNPGRQRMPTEVRIETEPSQETMTSKQSEAQEPDTTQWIPAPPTREPTSQFTSSTPSTDGSQSPSQESSPSQKKQRKKKKVDLSSNEYLNDPRYKLFQTLASVAVHGLSNGYSALGAPPLDAVENTTGEHALALYLYTELDAFSPRDMLLVWVAATAMPRTPAILGGLKKLKGGANAVDSNRANGNRENPATAPPS